MEKTLILCEEQLEMVTGGKVNPNMTPDGPNIDRIINDEFYDWVADRIVEAMNEGNPNSSYTTRSRGVDNDVDIFDFEI